MDEINTKASEGTVTISSAEYRGLVEELATAKVQYSDSNSKRWEENRRADAAEKKVKELETELEKLKACSPLGSIFRSVPKPTEYTPASGTPTAKEALEFLEFIFGKADKGDK